MTRFRFLVLPISLSVFICAVSVKSDTVPLHPSFKEADFDVPPPAPENPDAVTSEQVEDAELNRQKRLLIFNIYRGTPSNPHGTSRDQAVADPSSTSEGEVGTRPSFPLFGGYRLSTGGLVNPETSEALRVLARNLRQRARALWQTGRSVIGPMVSRLTGNAAAALGARNSNGLGGFGTSDSTYTSSGSSPDGIADTSSLSDDFNSSTGTAGDTGSGSSSFGGGRGGLGLDRFRINPETRETFRSAARSLSQSLGVLFRGFQSNARLLASRFRPTTTTESSFLADLEGLNE